MAEQKYKIQLEVEKEYNVKLMSHSSSIALLMPYRRAKYIGYGIIEDEINHIFSYEENNRKRYLVVLDASIEVDKEDIRLCLYINAKTNKLTCGEVRVLDEKDIQDRSDLLNIVRKLGEQL